MDQLIREYEVSKEHHCDVVSKLYAAGYTLIGIPVYSPSGMPVIAGLSEITYYQVWADGIVTRDNVPVDLPELKSEDYQMVRWEINTTIEQ